MVVPPDCVDGEAAGVRSPSVLISSLQIGGGLRVPRGKIRSLSNHHVVTLDKFLDYSPLKCTPGSERLS